MGLCLLDPRISCFPRGIQIGNKRYSGFQLFYALLQFQLFQALYKIICFSSVSLVYAFSCFSYLLGCSLCRRFVRTSLIDFNCFYHLFADIALILIGIVVGYNLKLIKMLYIFRVDTGTMMQFDMSLALERYVIFSSLIWASLSMRI